jgi:transcription termination factor NusB
MSNIMFFRLFGGLPLRITKDADYQNNYVDRVVASNKPKMKYVEKELFSAAVTMMPESNAMIDGLLEESRWDKDRIVLMDRIIMCTALAELRTFEKIPAAVTLNEYIELAKNFSTAASGKFVNGILNNAVKQLRKDGLIFKR